MSYGPGMEVPASLGTATRSSLCRDVAMCWSNGRSAPVTETWSLIFCRYLEPIFLCSRLHHLQNSSPDQTLSASSNGLRNGWSRVHPLHPSIIRRIFANQSSSSERECEVRDMLPHNPRKVSGCAFVTDKPFSTSLRKMAVQHRSDPFHLLFVSFNCWWQSFWMNKIKPYSLAIVRSLTYYE